MLPAWAGSELIAEAILNVVEDESLRKDLARRGRARLAELTQVDAKVAMLETIGELV